LVALTFSIMIAVVGAVGIVALPSLLTIARPFLIPRGSLRRRPSPRPRDGALHRCVHVACAHGRILGVSIIVAGLVTPLLGVERARMIVEWWEAQGFAFTRVWAGVALAFGLFLAYAIAARTPRSDCV
jgi:hypothetical protein